MNAEDYFTPDEWENLVDYEKTRILNTYDRYRQMKDLGTDATEPDFILEYKKRKRDKTNSSDCNEPPAKKSQLQDDETELRLSQELEELLQVSQDDSDNSTIAVDEELSEGENNDSDSSQEFNTIQDEIPLEINIDNVNKRVTRSTCKKLSKEIEKAENSSYSTRASARNKYYHEYSSPEEDDYEFCDKCNSEYLDGCPVHGLLQHIPDSSAANVDEASNEVYARRTIPLGLRVAPSAIKNAGLGVWTTKLIPGGSYFGPYKGIMVSNPGTGDYVWEIKYNRKRVKSRFVDGSDITKSNWMRYVNSARNFTEQNLVAYQYEKKIYYRVPRDITKNKELYVYYGDKYSRELGIDIEYFFEPPKIPLEVETFVCDICKTNFPNPIELDDHRTVLCGI